MRIEDPQAEFTALYEAQYTPVLRYAMREVPHAANDVVAETFMTAWRRFSEVPDPPLPWLLGVTRRVLANQRRGETRFQRLQLARILDTPGDSGGGGRSRAGARRSPRAMWLVPVGVAAALVAIVLTQLGVPGGGAPSLAQAATPPPLTYQAGSGTAREVLRVLADRIRLGETAPQGRTGYR